MENRKRNVHLHVMVTPDELAAIHERMAEAGISNAGAYVRKMALNGYTLIFLLCMLTPGWNTPNCAIS